MKNTELPFEWTHVWECFNEFSLFPVPLVTSPCQDSLVPVCTRHRTRRHFIREHEAKQASQTRLAKARVSINAR
jgi:hypothetical protein